MLSNKTLKFLQKNFAGYYRKYAHLIRYPPALEKREYGFSLFGSDTMIRHKRFESENDLRMFLESIIPSDVYYSVAYYEKPEEQMDQKGWIGADLVFDIDADHVESPCKERHDAWLCLNCGYSGHGNVVHFCPVCSSERIREEKWLCNICLEATKMEMLRLIDLLVAEFGFSEHELVVCFSGHRGYHLHIEREDIRYLDQMARKEIVDYIRGTGFVPRYHGLYEKSIERGRRIILGPDIDNSGWRGRLAKGVYEFLMTLSEDRLRKLGLRKNAMEYLLRERDRLLRKWGSRSWQFIKEVGGVRGKSWKKVLDAIIQSQAISIDVIVTTDIHRLIRLPNTLHGKTGLKAQIVSISQLEKFDPLTECAVFSESDVCTIYVKKVPEFRIGQQVYGPYKNETVRLPNIAAIYLMLKVGAELV